MRSSCGFKLYDTLLTCNVGFLNADVDGQISVFVSAQRRFFISSVSGHLPKCLWSQKRGVYMYAVDTCTVFDSKTQLHKVRTGTKCKRVCCIPQGASHIRHRLLHNSLKQSQKIKLRSSTCCSAAAVKIDIPQLTVTKED